MKTQYFEFEFTHKGRKKVATCQVYKLEGGDDFIYRYPIYRVAINTGEINPPVYMFYEVNQQDKRFCWFPVADETPVNDDHIMMSVRKSLINCYPGNENGKH